MSLPLLADLPRQRRPNFFCRFDYWGLNRSGCYWETSEEDGCDSDAGPTERAPLGDECRCRRRIVMAAMQHPQEKDSSGNPSVDFLSGPLQHEWGNVYRQVFT